MTQFEMQTASSNIWTQLADFIPYENNHDVFFCLFNGISIFLGYLKIKLSL